MNFAVLMAVCANDDPILFEAAIVSVLSNDTQPTEFLIVNDGKLTKDLYRVIDQFAGLPVVKNIELSTNSGLAAALNFGICSTYCEYIIRADADDINHPKRFGKLIGYLQDGYDLIGSYILEVERDGTPVSVKSVPLNQSDIKKYMQRRNPFNHMSVAFKKQSVVASGLYPTLYLKEDYGLWVRMIVMGYRAANIDEILVCATAGKGMYKRRSGLRYVISEYYLQNYIHQNKAKGRALAIFDFLLRSIVFVVPNKLRELIYLIALRKKFNGTVEEYGFFKKSRSNCDL